MDELRDVVLELQEIPDPNHYNMTPLHRAVSLEKYYIIRDVLERRRRLNMCYLNDYQDNDGNTALHYSVLNIIEPLEPSTISEYNNRVKIIELLMSYNINPLIVNKQGKRASYDIDKFVSYEVKMMFDRYEREYKN